MFRSVASVLALGLLVSAASGQTQQTSVAPQINPLLTTGTPVGTAMLTPIGSQQQKVGQQVGSGPNNGQMQWRQDPLPPGGQLIDLKNSVAPVPQSSLPPVLRTQESSSLIDQIYTKWATSLGLIEPASTPNNGYVPGMTRRAKERREKRWIWD
jgi:hypothetical protein